MVLKRNLPSSFSARLTPWEEANKPATHQPEAALRWGQDDEARKPSQAARQPGQGQTMQDRLPQSLIGGGEPAQARPQREPRNLLEAVQAAGRRRGVLPPEPEQEFDFPAIKRATDTLTGVLGRPPREGDIIPAGSVDRYLKSLSADQFDKREDIEFFNHVRDAYRLAYPTTSYDISGRMSDSPPVAIPFMPWGEVKPRSPQGMGAGTGMPGILKASAPAEEEDKPEDPKPRPDEKPEPKDPQPPKPPEDAPKEEEGPASAEQCQLWQAACDRYRAKAQELDAKEREVSARQQHYQSKAKNLAKDGEDLAEVVADLASLAIPALRVPQALRGIYAAYQKAQDMRDVAEKTEKMSDLISDAQKRAFYQELADNLAQEAAAIHESAEYYHNEASKLRSHAIPRCPGFL